MPKLTAKNLIKWLPENSLFAQANSDRYEPNYVGFFAWDNGRTVELGCMRNPYDILAGLKFDFATFDRDVEQIPPYTEKQQQAILAELRQTYRDAIAYFANGDPQTMRELNHQVNDYAVKHYKMLDIYAFEDPE